MARKSYDRMYREYDVTEFEKNIDTPKEEVVEEKEEKIPELEAELKPVVEEVKEEKKSSLITGTVIGGANLNVRNKPNGDIVTTVKEGTQVTIVDDSDPEWFKIQSPEGYVMKKFIRI